jgi:hypothetical protein
MALKISLIVLLIVSCQSFDLKDRPMIPENKIFYDLESDVGQISYLVCTEKRGKRTCSKVRKDLMKEWDKFSKNYILIPYDQAF